MKVTPRRAARPRIRRGSCPKARPATADPAARGASDQTYVLIANTSNAAGQVRLTLIPDSGANSTVTLPIAPFERLSVNVAAQFSLNNSRFSVLVDSLGTPGVPIVVDYARYASPGNETWGAGGASQAIVAPVQTPADTAPTVTATTPANGATNVLLHGNLSVTFSESVSVTPTAFTLQCPVGTPIALTNLTASPGTTFTLDPNVALPQNTTCTLTVVATQVTDTDPNDPPNTMAANHVITFTTETESAPTVTATTPANGATGVTVGSNLTVTFSEPVNVTGSTFVLECPAGTPIALTNTTASPAQAFTLDPNVNLPYCDDLHGDGRGVDGDGRRLERSAGQHGGELRVLVHDGIVSDGHGDADLAAGRVHGHALQPDLLADRPDRHGDVEPHGHAADRRDVQHGDR